MANGVYGADDPGNPGALSSAVAHVYSGVWNGATTLAVAFRGTDDLSDVAGWVLGMKAYYEHFRPLIDAIKAYVESTGVHQIFVTGHSLGGAMAQLFMEEVPSLTRYIGATFGSPGVTFGLGSGAPNSRIVHFEHSEDLVPIVDLSSDKGGERVIIPINDLKDTADDGIGITEHNMVTYLHSAKNFTLMGSGLPDFMKLQPHVPAGVTHIYADNNAAHQFGGDNTMASVDEQLYGLGGDDTIKGFWGDDELVGGTGSDLLIGGPSNYVSAALTDNDLLIGGAGDDYLQGGRGADRLAGGQGSDTFIYLRASDSPARLPKADTLQNFQKGFDKLDLSAIDAQKGVSGDQAFTFIGDAAFTATAGQLRSFIDGARTIVTGDVDGDGVGDFAIKVVGAPILDSIDFIL